MRLLRACWCALLVILAAPLPAAPADSLIAATDLFKIRQLASPVASPDGTSVVYTLRTIEERAERPGDPVYVTHLWIAPLDGRSAPRPLTRGPISATSPAWHPAGDRVAFVREEAGKASQLWILPLVGGGDPVAVAAPPHGVSAPRWSPDGSRLLFTAKLSAADVRAALERDGATGAALTPPWPEERAGAAENRDETAAKRDANSPAPAGATSPTNASTTAVAKTPPTVTADPDGDIASRRAWLARNAAGENPRVTSRLDFLGESGVEPAAEFIHVFVVDARPGATPVDVTPGYFSFNDAEWSPDGRTIVASGSLQTAQHPDRDLVRELVEIDVATRRATTLLARDDFSLLEPQPSPDGRQILFLAQPCKPAGELSYGQRRIGVVARAGGEVRFLAEKLDRNVAAARWSADGKLVYFTAATQGGVPLFRVGAGGGAPERLLDFATGVRDFAVAGADLALVLTKPANPYELYRVNAAGRAARILTTHNSEWLRDKKLATLERREVTRPDGLKIEFWVMRPPYFEGNLRYPLLVAIHGGPASMWGAGEDTMWHEFQYFAARGYFVVFANPRGSTGYGRAFQRANFQNWGPGPAGDVLAAADEAAKIFGVDRERQVIIGGSYGGYLTSWIVAHDQRFKAAVAIRGVYDLRTFLGEGNAWRLVPEHFGGYPWQPEIAKILDEQSPVTHVADIRTPLLIKHGDLDQRTGVAQSEMLYRSLKILGRPVEYARYPRGTHELSRSGEPAQRLDRVVRFAEFFERFIGAPAQPAPPPAPAPAQAPAPAMNAPAATPPMAQASAPGGG